MYFSRVFSITSSGRLGTGGCLFQRIRFEVVAHELLVEARLRTAGDVKIPRPEARRVGRQDLVDEDDVPLAAAVGDAAEFELGVGDDDAPVFRVGSAARVQPQRQVAELFDRVAPDNLARLVLADVHVVARTPPWLQA